MTGCLTVLDWVVLTFLLPVILEAFDSVDLAIDEASNSNVNQYYFIRFVLLDTRLASVDKWAIDLLRNS